MARRILLNADLGEGFSYDADLMPLIDIANIACGAHAGDRLTMKRTLQLAKQHSNYVSYHVGYNDKKNFGRISIQYSDSAFVELIENQFNALLQLSDEIGISIDFIKPHGALYHDLAGNQNLVALFLTACEKLEETLGSKPGIIGPANSALLSIGEKSGFKLLPEGFVDRRYGDDGILLPRSHPHALIDNPLEAAQQARTIGEQGHVVSNSGKNVPLDARTLCIHGDTATALAIAREVSKTLEN